MTIYKIYRLYENNTASEAFADSLERKNVCLKCLYGLSPIRICLMCVCFYGFGLQIVDRSTASLHLVYKSVDRSTSLVYKSVDRSTAGLHVVSKKVLIVFVYNL